MPTARGEYRPFFTRLLNGPSFQALSADARACLYPLKLRLPAAGIAAVSGLVFILADDTALPPDRVEPALRELEAHEWIRRERNVVWLIRGLEFEPTLNPKDRKHQTHVRSALNALPTLEIVEAFRAVYAEWLGDPTAPQATPSESPSGTDTRAFEGPSKALVSPTPTPTPRTTPPLPPPHGADAPDVALVSRGNGAVLHRRPRSPPSQARTVTQVTERLTAFLTAVGEESAREVERDEVRSLMVDLSFAYWAKKTRHDQAKLDRKRFTTLRQRLVESSDNVHQMLFVVDGALKDDNLMGRRHDSPRKYDGISTLYRDYEQVERLAALGGYQEGKAHPMATKYLDVVLAHETGVT